MDLDRHLTENEIAGYLDHDLPAADRRSVEAHLDACADCRTELIAVHDLAAAPLRPSRPRWLRWGLPVALAAAVGALALIETIRPTPDSAPRERPGFNPTEAAAAIVPVAPSESALVTTLRPAFVWRHLPAERYRFTLLTADGTPLWTAETSDTSIAVPLDVSLEGGSGYFWRVDAIRDGVTATTGAVRFTVAR